MSVDQIKALDYQKCFVFGKINDVFLIEKRLTKKRKTFYHPSFAVNVASASANTLSGCARDN